MNTKTNLSCKNLNYYQSEKIIESENKKPESKKENIKKNINICSINDQINKPSLNLKNFSQKIGNNYESINSLEGFNFDSEKSCKDMLEQVKKVVEYNTNFTNNNNSNNNRFENPENFYVNKKNDLNYTNNCKSYNNLYSNKDELFLVTNYFKNNNFGHQNSSPINIGSSKMNTVINPSNNLNRLVNNNSVNIENDFHHKIKLDPPHLDPFKNSNFNQFTNFSKKININNIYTNYALLNKDVNKSDCVNDIMFTANPFKNHNIQNSNQNEFNNNHPNNLENNSFSGITTGNFNNNPESSQNNEFLNNEKSTSVAKINGRSHRNSKESRIPSLNILNEYKLSIDGKIKNLKKIINQKMGYKKLKNFSNDIFVNILNFFNTYDICNVMNMNSYMKQKILAILTDSSRIICNQFKTKFTKHFILKNSQILITNVKKNKKIFSKISLVLKFQINDPNFKNKSIILGYLNKYYGENDCLKNFFIFDVRAPGPLSFWVMREYTSVKI